MDKLSPYFRRISVALVKESVVMWARASLLILITFTHEAMADDCNLLTAAMVKESRAPQRMVIESSRNGKLLSRVELVSVGNKQYLKLGGSLSSAQWSVMPWNADSDESGYSKWIATQNRICHLKQMEFLDGQKVDMLVVHTKDSRLGEWDTTWWIGHESGMPVKNQRLHRDGELSVTTWSYAGVKAPITNSQPQ